MYAKNAWEKYNETQIKEIMNFNEGYKDFITKGKTERLCVKEAVKKAMAAGYKDLNDVDILKPGDKVYVTNMNKNIALFVIGKQSIENGLRILGAHIDSPRLDLKQNPLYESEGFALLDTHYYGGVKKYQWVTIPLSMIGVVVKKDGTVINVNIGEDENDPVVGISDLLIHLSADQLKKEAAKVIEGEDLDVTFASMPLKDTEKDAVKANVLNILKEKYDFEEEDFLSAEIEIVPSGKARDYGIDRSMVAGYGHDDRVCAYTSLMAILDMDIPEYTSCAILVDKEEIGSVGATGAHSLFFENIISELLSKQNAAYLGKGIVFNKYTGSRGKSGSNDANPEYMAQIRNVLDEANVYYQTAELGKVDQGGGGTIAYILGNYNMNVIDAGVAVLNMHAPMEIVSKVDVYEAYLAYRTFLQKI